MLRAGAPQDAGRAAPGPKARGRRPDHRRPAGDVPAGRRSRQGSHRVARRPIITNARREPLSRWLRFSWTTWPFSTPSARSTPLCYHRSEAGRGSSVPALSRLAWAHPKAVEILFSPLSMRILRASPVRVGSDTHRLSRLRGWLLERMKARSRDGTTVVGCSLWRPRTQDAAALRARNAADVASAARAGAAEGRPSRCLRLSQRVQRRYPPQPRAVVAGLPEHHAQHDLADAKEAGHVARRLSIVSWRREDPDRATRRDRHEHSCGHAFEG
jgi:hypothetical protein